MAKILVTGFVPFGGQEVNPALEAVRALPDAIGGASVVCVEVPVSYAAAAQTVAAAMDAHAPDAVVCVGQAAGRTCVSVERVAVNVDDCEQPDNDGVVRHDAPIDPDGPDALLSTLPVRAMARAVEAAGLPCQVSDSAGTYVCNHLMYETLRLCATTRPGVLAGFVHVPLLPQQAVRGDMRGKPTMSQADVVASLEAAIGAVAAGLSPTSPAFAG